MEGLEGQRIRESAEPPFYTPYSQVILKEFGKKSLGEREAFAEVVREVDKQEIRNFDIFRSETFPGVAFSYTKLTVTPEFVKKLEAFNKEEGMETVSEGAVDVDKSAEGQEENTNAKRQDYYIFPAFHPPPEGHALDAEDIALDRFIRLLPRVARAMRRGEKPPEVNVYLVGTAHAFGGAVTPDWIRRIKRRGLEDYGKLIADFVIDQEPTEPAEIKNTHIVLQGVSKGAIAAERTSKYLPRELQEVTQRLLDNPAGHHRPSRWVKGAQVALGMGLETVSRMILDASMRNLMKQSGGFIDDLSRVTGVPKDGKDQSKLKRSAGIAEGLALIHGSPIDTEETRSFIRKGVFDPLTFSPKRLWETWRKRIINYDRHPVFFEQGKGIEVPFKGYHFFIYKNFPRWERILKYCQGRKEKAQTESEPGK